MSTLQDGNPESKRPSSSSLAKRLCERRRISVFMSSAADGSACEGFEMMMVERMSSWTCLRISVDHCWIRVSGTTTRVAAER